MPLRDAHRHRFQTLQSIRIPRLMRVVTAMLVVGTAAGVALLALMPWVQTSSGMGSVTALDPNDRQQNISALVPGRIEEWFVQEGSEVSEGDPIVRIVDNDPQLLQRLRAERAELEVQRQAAQAGLDTAEIELARARQLFEDGLAARRDYERARIQVEDFRARVASANAGLARADTNLSRQSVQLVTAPRDGIIQNIKAGDSSTFVPTGTVLASFVPDTPERVVEVFVAGRDIGLIRPGEDARIQFEGWPAVQFSGWPSVSIGTFEGVVTAVDPTAQPDGRFRVLISEAPDAEVPWPDERFVRFGSAARAWILLETVSAGYELWRQLNTFPPSLPREASPTPTGTGAPTTASPNAR